MTRQDEFAYVKAVLADNPYINDPKYLKSLQSLPPQKRKAYVEGNWDVFEGQYFKEMGSNKACHSSS